MPGRRRPGSERGTRSAARVAEVMPRRQTFEPLFEHGATAEGSLEDRVVELEHRHASPTTCLLYTSPSPRD
eukprot:15484623-Alexandrium_andersonii.AAC.1